MLAALLAEKGFDSTQEIVEGKQWLLPHLQRNRRAERLTAGLGERWLIETNGHKPYACGVVLHPLIDAVIALRNRTRIDPAAVSEISLRVHPLVLSITNVLEPATGLQSKFSIVHSAAVALVDGAAGIAQYSDAKAADPVVAALRRKTTAVADAALRADEAYAAITAGGQRHDIHIPHASGTAANPMSDAAICGEVSCQCGAGDRSRTCSPCRRTCVVVWRRCRMCATSSRCWRNVDAVPKIRKCSEP